MAVTQFAVLTPPGVGAIAVIHLQGPEAGAIIACLFESKNQPNNWAVGSLHFGRFGDPAVDEVVITRLPAQHEFEIATHGGQHVVQSLQTQLKAKGAELASNSDTSIEVAARFDIQRAPTFRTASILADQMNGALREALTRAAEEIDLNHAVEILNDLLRFSDVGTHLLTPWRVVLVGEPNVGKSSLVNALAGFQRSIVTDVAGTTRDLVAIDLAFDGWPITIVDTAGLRDTSDELEQAGVSLSEQAQESADLVLNVFDASQSSRERKRPEISTSDLPSPLTLNVINKIDLPAAWNFDQIPTAVHVSATTGRGLDALMSAMVRHLIPIEMKPGQPVPFRAELITAVESARSAFANRQIPQGRQILRDQLHGLDPHTPHPR